jgi:hypothetical protein
MVYLKDARFRHPYDRGQERPIAANDNIPQDESGASAGFGVSNVMNSPLNGGVQWVAGQSPTAHHERGQYIGLTRQQTHERFTADVIKWRQDDTPAFRQQQGLEALAELKGYVYVGSPYAKYPAGLEDAARVASACAGELMKMGIKVYCPIAHGHAVSQQVELPRDWDFWKSRDQPLIDGASAIVVLEMRGWYDSVGLTYEIEEFMKANKPILYIEPIALGVEERK